jgi:putative endonuclease
MFYVYILQSLRNGDLYTGFSKDLKTRIKSHFSKDVYTTRRMGDIKLVFYEAYLSEKDARRREKYFKTTKGKRTLKLILEDSLKIGAFV